MEIAGNKEELMKALEESYLKKKIVLSNIIIKENGSWTASFIDNNVKTIGEVFDEVLKSLPTKDKMLIHLVEKRGLLNYLKQEGFFPMEITSIRYGSERKYALIKYLEEQPITLLKRIQDSDLAKISGFGKRTLELFLRIKDEYL